MKKKLSSLLLVLALLLTMLPVTAQAANTAATVYVSVSNQGVIPQGKHEEWMSMVPVELSGQESYTVLDALTALHAEHYSGGDAGFATAENEYGTLSMTTLWGETEGVGGFYVNHSMPLATVDQATVSDGDVIDAIVYRSDWSDSYAYFDKTTAAVETGAALTLTLSYEHFVNFSPQTDPVENASITVNGVATDDTTDAQGSAVLTFDDAGTYVVSAEGSDNFPLTAPVCVVTVADPITVEFEVASGELGGFLMEPTSLTVSPGLAAKYGYETDHPAAPGNVTALDAMVSAHLATFGDAFEEDPTAYLAVSASGFVSTFFGEAASYCCTLVNGEAPGKMGDSYFEGDTADAAVLHDGDAVLFGFFTDAYCTDDALYFTRRSVAVEAGEPFEVTLKQCFPLWQMYGYPSKPEKPAEGYTLLIDGVESDSYTTDAEGKVTLSFAQAGTYTLSATDGYGEFFPPYCVVEVGEAGSIPNNKASAITVADAASTPDFSEEVYAYTLPVQSGTKKSLSFQVTAASAGSISAVNNGGAPVALTSGKSKSISLFAGKNVIDITVAPPSSSNALPKTYTYTVSRQAAVKSIALTDGDDRSVALAPSFTANTTAYTAKLAAGSTVKLLPTAEEPTGSKFQVTQGDGVYEDLSESGYPVGEGANIFTLRAVSKDLDQIGEREYTLSVVGIAAADAVITVPEGAFLSLTDPSGNSLSLSAPTSADGRDTYRIPRLMCGEPYRYTVGQYGHTAKGGTFVPTAEHPALDVDLEAAEAPVSDITAEWKNFRNSDSNMAVVSAQTPVSAAGAELKWETSVGEGYSPVTYLMVDGKVVAASGTKLYLLNSDTGAIEKSATMADSRGYGYMPPVYGGGMLFVSLSDGKIQAFDARTLESKWLYTDALGGQALSAMTYADGHLYTGFGNDASSQTQNWVCIQTADEVPSSGTEPKYAAWTFSHKGGFYWSGAYLTEGYLTVGGDNAALLTLDRQTGALVDREDVDGDIRCSIAAWDGKICFVTKGGGFYTAVIDEAGQIRELTRFASIGGESTSTPVVVNGYAYVGVRNGTIAQINLSSGDVETVAAPAYSQSSFLASTAYQEKTYLYFVCNARPGGIQALCVDDRTGAMQLSELFVPSAARQNYSIANVMCDANGVLYFANDSGYLFAVAPAESAHCPVIFTITPSDAVLTVKDSAGNPVPCGSSAYVYDLPAGTYTYTAAKGGDSASGSFTVTAEEEVAHTPKSIPVTIDTTTSPSTFPVFISVADPQGSTYLTKTGYTVSSGTTAYELLCMTDLEVEASFSQFGAYVKRIEGLGEYDEGSQSGWMFRVNGEFASESASSVTLRSGDYVEWLYTRDLGSDVGQSYNPATGSGSVIRTDASVSKGVASVSVTAKEMSDAIASVKTRGGETITIQPSNIGEAGTVSVTMPKSAVQSIVSGTNAALVIETAHGTVSIPSKALKAIAAQASGSSIEIIIAKKDAALAETLTGRELTAPCIAEVSICSNGEKLTSFDGQELTIELAVDAKRFSVGSSYRAYIISDDGKVERTHGQCVKSGSVPVVRISTGHLSTFVVTAEAPLPFTDVDGSWALDAIQYVYDHDLMQGSTATTFGPNGTTTRGQIVTILWRMAGSPAAGKTSFRDVADTAYCAQAIAWACENGLANGYADATFRPNAPITREQMAAFLFRYAQLMKYESSARADLSVFTDAAQVSAYAQEALAWANAAGLVGGTGKTTLTPQGNATRAQVAVILQRFCETVRA
ncbi:S-layer homology domain-containing protein [Oscillibacter sp.]|uniref:S-layer homology domain-containing protein n=1 Tax=Oscillibacter sp. TaxID=1945593 RepID=UPI00260A0886|nr:S-layer homology domain-containing protein [Oscillibacter sp.]MDD3347211.1 S-layer homology domain-containing protein [Oscillibacter sp.]